MTTAFIFPGQGSQSVGMGRDLAEAFAPARQVFEEVDDALGQHLFRLMTQGPEDELTLTANAQPALMAVSLATLRVLQSETGLDLANAASHLAGHSLGEYAAHAAAGTLDVPTTARLLRTRGEAMQAAVPVGEGAMAALLGLDMQAVEKICTDAAPHPDGGTQVVTIANDNAPGQIVISGHAAAVERACVLAKEAGAKRALPLPVSAPFHCPLMAPAAETMAEALSVVTFSPPAVAIVANVTAAASRDPNQLRGLLVEQVTGRVRWRESVAAMAEAGVSRFVELGAGKVLAGLVKRIAKEAETISIGDPKGIDAFSKSL